MKLVYKEEAGTLEIALGHLRKGQVLVLPTDTIYGFSCLADNLPAINDIKRIKKRQKNSFIILISSIKMLKKYCFLNTKQEIIINSYLQKKAIYSFVLKSKNLNKPYSNDGSLAVRLPKSDFLIKIIEKLKKPIVSTSLNLHKQELIEIQNIEKFFKRKKLKPALVVVNNIKLGKLASKILDIRSNQIIKLR